MCVCALHTCTRRMNDLYLYGIFVCVHLCVCLHALALVVVFGEGVYNIGAFMYLQVLYVYVYVYIYIYI